MDSIVCQNYPYYEVIIVDGLSSDNTLDIIKSFYGRVNNLKIISEKDNGIYDAMNKGIKNASGEWLYFLGSDDYFYSCDVLDKISFYFNNETDVIYGNVFYEELNSLYDGFFSNEKLFFMNICHQSIFFKRKLCNKLGEYKINYPCWADWEYNFRWFYNKEVKRKFIDTTVAFYAKGGFSNAKINFNNDNFSIDRIKLFSDLTGRKIYFIKIKQLYYTIRFIMKLKGLWFSKN
jgi:glycosyltransferase involved in cell wall biosynthesis